MTVKVNLQDWSKFLSERTVNNGFFLQNAYVGDAVENLLMRANFPKANIKKLNNYRQGAKNRSAISAYSFNEESVDRSGNNIISSSGLRARFWGMPTNKKDISVKDILADAIDKELSVFEKALGEKPFVSPSFITLSKDISTLSTDALRLVDYSFTGTDSAVYSEYFNGVFDGYYIPTDSGNQYIIINIAYGGVRVYLDDVLIINKWKLATSQERHQSALLNLQAGVPRKIRIEFWHSFNNSGAASFRISLYKALQGFGDVLVSASQCCTIVALDSVGSKNTSSVVSNLDSNNHRNNAIYINSPKLNQIGGLTSDTSNKAVLLESNAYIRIPYSANTNVVNTSSVNYTGDWSIEIYAKFASGVFSSDGEYISNWNNSASTSGFEFFNNSSSHGFKIKTTANTVVSTETVSSNTALSNSAFTHLMVTYGDGVLSYYVNGSVVESKTLTGTPIDWASKNTTIGGRGASYSGGAEVAPATIRSFIIDEFAVYNKTLSASDVSERYTEAVMQPLTQFAFLYGNENSLSEIMNDITFADMGRMYINELNIANYEHFYRFFEPSINQHSAVQTSLSDSTNIIDGNYVVQLQCNKVVVPVASVQTAGLARQQLWVAPDKSTLAVTKITANLTANANVVYVTNTIDPVFSDTGYIQIDSEVIKYLSKTATSFNGLERGQFQTTAASHLTDAKAKETRYYDIKFDKAPAFNVRSPLISAIDFENPDKVSILRYIPGPYGAELLLAASESVDVGSVVYLQGDDVFTDIPYTTTIAGTPVVITEQNIQIKEQSSSLADSIKKYGVKDITIQSNFITDSVHAKKLADFIIDKTQTPVPILNITTTVLPKTQLGDRIRITSLGALDITNTDYWVISYNTSVGDQVTQSLILRKVS